MPILGGEPALNKTGNQVSIGRQELEEMGAIQRMLQELAEDAKEQALRSDPEQPALYWLDVALGLGTAITQL